MNANPKLTRRSLLAATGLGGASLFLPSLARRAAAQGTPPKRFVVFYTLHGTVYDQWKMRRPGLADNADWEFPFDDADPASFSEILRPLHGVRSDLLVLDGLAQTSAIADVMINAHPKGHVHSLTGAPIARITNEAASSTAPSIDQIVAQAVRRTDRLSSLELFGFPYDPIIYSEPGVSLPFEPDPQAAFDRLFPGTPTQQPSTNAERVLAAQSSVLDLVQGEFDIVRGRVGTEDRRKLDLHRDLVRDLEMRLGSLAGISCDRPTRPGRIPFTDYQARFDAFVRIAAAALACDLTRVATIGMGIMPNSMVGAPPGDIHADFAHHVDENSMAAQVMTSYHRLHATQLRSIIDTFKSIPEGTGTMLDNTIILWANELATGQHKFTVWPVVLAGGGGTGLRTGRYIHWRPNIPTPDPHPNWQGVEPFLGPPHNKLLVSIARAMGIDTNQIGAARVTTVSGQNLSLTGPLDRLT